MPRLRQSLFFLLGVVFITALPAADLARVDDAEIQRLMNTVGQNDTEKRVIQRRLSGWKDMIESPKNKALEDANVEIAAISQTVLVGGSTRMPMIQELLRKLAGGQFSKRIPKDNPRDARTSLISVKDFLPRFGVFNNSTSVR